MPEDVYTQGTALSIPSPKNDGYSTDLTGSDNSGDRSVAPENFSFPKRVVAAYKEQKDTKLTTKLSAENLDEYIEFDMFFNRWEAELKAENERTIAIGSLRMFNAFWTAVAKGEEWIKDIHIEVRDLIEVDS